MTRLCTLCYRKHYAKSLCYYHYFRKWCKENPDKVKINTRRYITNNRERYLKNCSISQKKNYNREKNTERARRYRETPSGIEATRRAARKYRLKQLGVMI